jgi:hypothetical protein
MPVVLALAVVLGLVVLAAVLGGEDDPTTIRWLLGAWAWVDPAPSASHPREQACRRGKVDGKCRRHSLLNRYRAAYHPDLSSSRIRDRRRVPSASAARGGWLVRGR